MMTVFKLSKLPKPLFNLMARAWPDLAESIKILDDPIKLHYAMHMMVGTIAKGLDEDHDTGIGREDLCFSAYSASIGEESPTSIPSGSDGLGEVDTDGSDDGGVPSSIQQAEDTSEGVDL
jgi:hypothetical protein